MLVRLEPSREPNGIAEGRGDEQRIHRAPRTSAGGATSPLQTRKKHEDDHPGGTVSCPALCGTWVCRAFIVDRRSHFLFHLARRLRPRTRGERRQAPLLPVVSCRQGPRPSSTQGTSPKSERKANRPPRAGLDVLPSLRSVVGAGFTLRPLFRLSRHLFLAKD